MKRPTSTATAARPAVEPDADPARARAQAQPQVQAPARAPVQASPAPTPARLPAADVPRPRADAVRNRERILTAAREAFVEFGSAAPFDEVARRAGIGNATLYRHFPDRPTLVHHVVLFTMARVTASAEASSPRNPTPSPPCAGSRTRPRTSGSAPCARCSPTASTANTPNCSRRVPPWRRPS